ncbi:MAG: ABC transporter permease [Gemmataceae bacterium]|nr:ABC transporter permease [Gemmataceae bacterium]
MTCPAVVDECTLEARTADGDRDAHPEAPLTVIQPRTGWLGIDLTELWRYRELLGFLTWRDIKVRYKQTILGASWALIQPLATMAVFTLFLGRNAAGAVEGYSLFVFAGLLPWIFFANGLSSGGQSIVGNQNLVTKVYFPRLLIPMGAVVAGLVDLAIAFGLLLIMLPFYGITPSWSILWAPVIVVLLTAAAFGVGALLSALTVAYRDFRHVVPFLTQLWMFATPTIYLQGSMGESLDRWLPLNPAHGLVASFRQAVLGQTVDLRVLGISALVSVALLMLGVLYFRKVERSFADVI